MRVSGRVVGEVAAGRRLAAVERGIEAGAAPTATPRICRHLPLDARS
jgi:hypothetical protein